MRRIWLVLVMAAVLAVFCTVTLGAARRMTGELRDRIEELRGAADGDRATAGDIDELKTLWDEYEGSLSIYTRHSELEEVGRAITVLRGFWAEGQYDLYRVACDEALLAVEHLWETSRPTLRNIM